MTASNNDDPDNGLTARDDAALERLYRKGAPRSPAALDEAVLAHAEATLNATRRRRQRRLRVWSLAASLTLVTGLAWQLRDEAVPRTPAVAAKAAAPLRQPRYEFEAASGTSATPSAPAARALLPEISVDEPTRKPASAPEQRETDAAPEPAHGKARRAEKQAEAPAVADQLARKDANQAAQSASAGSIVLAEPLPLTKAVTAPSARAEAAAAAAYKPETASADSSTPDVELQRLLQSIRALPEDSSFLATASRETLKPAAFADRMAAAASTAALLKEAAGWQLIRPDGSAVPADRWLRSLPKNP